MCNNPFVLLLLGFTITHNILICVGNKVQKPDGPSSYPDHRISIIAYFTWFTIYNMDIPLCIISTTKLK